VDDPICNINHSEIRARRLSRSGVYVQSTTLHCQMNRAKDLTEHIEASQLVCDESDIEATTGRERESAVEIMGYRETMSLRTVVIPDVDHHVLAKGDVHDRPRTGMILTIIEANVEPFVYHHNCENGRAS
jgi:hypothetical protein